MAAGEELFRNVLKAQMNRLGPRVCEQAARCGFAVAEVTLIDDPIDGGIAVAYEVECNAGRICPYMHNEERKLKLITVAGEAAIAQLGIGEHLAPTSDPNL